MSRKMNRLEEYTTRKPEGIKYDEDDLSALVVNKFFEKTVNGERVRATPRNSPVVQDNLDMYNQWVTNRIIRQLEDPIPYNDGMLYLSNVRVNNPIRESSGTPLYPAGAVNDGISYQSSLIVDATFRDFNGNMLTTRPNVQLGRLPTMVGSIRCNLYGKTSSELNNLGSCEHDIFGYFIIDGREFYVRQLERIRVNYSVIYSGRFDNRTTTVCRMTPNTLRGTTFSQIFEHFDLKIPYLFFGDQGNTMRCNPFAIGGIYGFSLEEIKNITDMMLASSFKNKKQIVEYIYTALNNYASILSVEHYDQRALILQYMKDEQPKDTLSAISMPDDMAARIDIHLYPQIQEIYGTSDINLVRVKKLQTLIYDMIQYTRYKIGNRPMDDRNSYDVKRIVTPAMAIESEFIAYWEDFRRNIRAKPYLEATKQFSTMASYESLTTILSKALQGNKWSTKNSNMDADTQISQDLKDETFLMRQTQVTEFDVPTSRKVKADAVRALATTQAGYVGIAFTPEGKNCGLMKNKAITCYLSTMPSYEVVKSVVSQYASPTYTDDNTTPIVLNGVPIGWCNELVMYKYLIQQRRRMVLPHDILIMRRHESVVVSIDPGRPTRPLFVIEDNRLLILELQKMFDDYELSSDTLSYMYNAVQGYKYNGVGFRDLTFGDYMSLGVIEYLDASEMEQDHILVAQSIKDYKDSLVTIENVRAQNDRLREEYNSEEDPILKNKLYEELMYNEKMQDVEKRRYSYSHCEMTTTVLFGVPGSIIPFPENNPAPRNSYQCNMGKQAIGISHSNVNTRFRNGVRALMYPNPPIAHTQAAENMGLNSLPAGQTVHLLFSSAGGHNQEDAMVLNQKSVDLGMFRTVKYYIYNAATFGGTGVDTSEHVDNPLRRKTDASPEERRRYRALNNDGVPLLGSYVNEGDYVIGKIRTRRNMTDSTRSENIVESASIKIKKGEYGVVDKVYVQKVGNVISHIKVRIRQVRVPEVGDKFASRYAQKSTVGKIVPDEDLPRTKYGMTPDIIVNPHAIPSRMTVGKVIELVTSKRAVFTGDKVNATPHAPFNAQAFMSELRDYGFSPSGDEKFYSGTTGDLIHKPLQFGPIYYQPLVHQVRDKIQSRAKGTVDLVTLQPLKGRKNEGGIRVGEMERDALIAWGATSALYERLCGSSDKYKGVFCKDCGVVATVYRYNKEIPIKCPCCKKCKITGEGAQQVKQGEFVQCSVPYSFILFRNYMIGMGINMRFNLQDMKDVKKIDDIDELFDEEDDEEGGDVDEYEEDDFQPDLNDF
jgi:DNA-directed RNA polymerase II subunit RPB2